MTDPAMVQVTIYDAPTVASPPVAAAAAATGHQAMTMRRPGPPGQGQSRTPDPGPGPDPGGRLPRPGAGGVYQCPPGPPGPQRLPQTALLGSVAYPTPLVYINGQGRFAGALPVERIREEVAKILGVA